MKSAKIVLVMTAAFVVSLFAGALWGYVQRSGETHERNSDEIKQVAIEEETLLKDEKTVTHYSVKIEENDIVLKEVFDDDTTKEIERVMVNTKVLPPNDVRVLSEGVAFSTREEALILIENFVS